ncbi:MAG: phage holin family protein [Verrucomicrobiaceae bacterium]|nr:MAG: phage holin family protein [Verrucomicrobiaceae bacterium]
MNHSSGTNPSPPVASSGGASVPPNWRTALADLAASRLALINLEIQQAVTSGLKRGVILAAAAILLVIAWLVLLAGGIGAISVSSGWAWYWVALSAGGVHLLIAIGLLLVAKKPAPPSFKITRAEFKKDREWLANFQSPNKSND